MNNFYLNILDLLDSNEDELSQLKKIIVNLRKRPEDKKIVSKYSIPAFYSIWEGFFVKSLIEFISYINSFNFHKDEINETILAHNLDINLNLKDPRSNFGSVARFNEELTIFYKKDFYLGSKIITKSNVNFNVANSMLKRLTLGSLPGDRKNQLNKLLQYRNNISHGEGTVPYDDSVINELSLVVTNCMYDMVNIIEQGMNTDSFLVDST